MSGETEYGRNVESQGKNRFIIEKICGSHGTTHRLVREKTCCLFGAI